MAIVTPTSIRQALAAIVLGSDEITPEHVAEWLTNTLDAVAVGGGIAVGRGFGNDPPGQTLSTTAATSTKILGWTNIIEQRGCISDPDGGRITIGPGGAGHHDIDWNIAFKGTVGVGYLFALKVSRAAVNGGAPAFEMDSTDEEFILNANQIGHCDGDPRIVNLQEGDWFELHGIATNATNTFILRQGQVRTARIDSP